MPPSRPDKYDRNNPNTGPPQPSHYTSRKDYDAAEIDCFHLTCERLVGEDRYSDFVKADSRREEFRSPEPVAPRVSWRRQWPSEDARDIPTTRQSDQSSQSSPQTRSTPPLSTSKSSPAYSSEHERAKSEDLRPVANGLESYSSHARPQSVLSVASLLSTEEMSVVDPHVARQNSETRPSMVDQAQFTARASNEQSRSDQWTRPSGG